jgi:DNA-binding XRE family transcriptional regulator
LKTINELFSANLVRFRADRTQEQIAEKAGIPTVSYQRAENGFIPQAPNRAAPAARRTQLGLTARD